MVSDHRTETGQEFSTILITESHNTDLNYKIYDHLIIFLMPNAFRNNIVEHKSDR